MRKPKKPQKWQTNPKNVNTDRVQYWRNGILHQADMNLDVARSLILQGKAFVITDQAIGALDVAGNMNS